MEESIKLVNGIIQMIRMGMSPDQKWVINRVDIYNIQKQKKKQDQFLSVFMRTWTNRKRVFFF